MYATQLAFEKPHECNVDGYGFKKFYNAWKCPRIELEISVNSAKLVNIAYLLYENIDQILLIKLHGPMQYKIGVTCVYTEHVFYTLL